MREKAKANSVASDGLAGPENEVDQDGFGVRLIEAWVKDNHHGTPSSFPELSMNDVIVESDPTANLSAT